MNNQAKDDNNEILEAQNIREVVSNDSSRDSVINFNNQSKIWDINLILSKIFSYADFEDLVKFNIVNKRWNSSINPLIHASLKLLRGKDILKKIYAKDLKKSDKIDAEAAECIAINAKFSQLVKKFTFSEKLSHERTIEFFGTFKFITKLAISQVTLCINQFLYILKPLSMLQKLYITSLKIKRSPKNTVYETPVQLPLSLNTLRLTEVDLTHNSDLFIQTLNSHTNLIKFSLELCDINDYLDPFLKNYTSLKSLEYKSILLDIPEQLSQMAESNPQILDLKIWLMVWNNELSSTISRSLVNLRNFALFDSSGFMPNQHPMFFKFFSATNIRKLDLNWANLSTCSLNSILLNCPNLEELILIKNNILTSENTPLSLSVPNGTSLKRLSIFCTTLSVFSLDSILSNCPDLTELDIQLPKIWQEWSDLIGKRLKKLDMLSIHPDDSLDEVGIEDFYLSIYYNGLTESTPIYKSTITNLILNNCSFDTHVINIFDHFKKLKTIKLPVSESNNICEIDIDALNSTHLPHYKAKYRKIDGVINMLDIVKLDKLP
jgi:hypothetical protein